MDLSLTGLDITSQIFYERGNNMAKKIAKKAVAKKKLAAKKKNK